MGVFHVFKIAQMVPNRAKYHSRVLNCKNDTKSRNASHILSIANQFKNKLRNRTHSVITFTFRGTGVYQNAY